MLKWTVLKRPSIMSTDTNTKRDMERDMANLDMEKEMDMANLDMVMLKPNLTRTR